VIVAWDPVDPVVDDGGDRYGSDMWMASVEFPDDMYGPEPFFWTDNTREARREALVALAEQVSDPKTALGGHSKVTHTHPFTGTTDF
jgi:hypothetical protein